jgi:hypothetical protein
MSTNINSSTSMTSLAQASQPPLPPPQYNSSKYAANLVDTSSRDLNNLSRRSSKQSTKSQLNLSMPSKNNNGEHHKHHHHHNTPLATQTEVPAVPKSRNMSRGSASQQYAHKLLKEDLNSNSSTLQMQMHQQFLQSHQQSQHQVNAYSQMQESLIASLSTAISNVANSSAHHNRSNTTAPLFSSTFVSLNHNSPLKSQHEKITTRANSTLNVQPPPSSSVSAALSRQKNEQF